MEPWLLRRDHGREVLVLATRAAWNQARPSEARCRSNAGPWRHKIGIAVAPIVLKPPHTWLLRDPSASPRPARGLLEQLASRLEYTN